MKLGCILLWLMLVFSACGTYQTEVWLHDNGSGKARFHFDFDKAVQDMETAQRKLRGKSESQKRGYGNEFVEPVKSISATILSEVESNGNGLVEDALEVQKAQSQRDSVMKSTVIEFIRLPMHLQAWAVELPKRAVADTSFAAKDIFISKAEETSKSSDLLKNISLVGHFDSLKRSASLELHASFESVKMLEKSITALIKAQIKESDGVDSMLYFDYVSDFTRSMSCNIEQKKLTVKDWPLFVTDSIALQIQKMLGEEKSDIYQFFENHVMRDMMMTFHLPGKILEVKGDINYHIQNEQTLVVHTSIMDCFINNKVPGFTVKYK